MSKKKKLAPETYYKKYAKAIIKKMNQAIESEYKARREREDRWFAADPHIEIPVENVKQDKLSYIQTLEQKIKHLEEDRDRILVAREKDIEQSQEAWKSNIGSSDWFQELAKDNYIFSSHLGKIDIMFPMKWIQSLLTMLHKEWVGSVKNNNELHKTLADKDAEIQKLEAENADSKTNPLPKLSQGDYPPMPPVKRPKEDKDNVGRIDILEDRVVLFMTGNEVYNIKGVVCGKPTEFSLKEPHSINFGGPAVSITNSRWPVQSSLPRCPDPPSPPHGKESKKDEIMEQLEYLGRYCVGINERLEKICRSLGQSLKEDKAAHNFKYPPKEFILLLDRVEALEHSIGSVRAGHTHNVIYWCDKCKIETDLTGMEKGVVYCRKCQGPNRILIKPVSIDKEEALQNKAAGQWISK